MLTWEHSEHFSATMDQPSEDDSETLDCFKADTALKKAPIKTALVSKLTCTVLFFDAATRT